MLWSQIQKSVQRALNALNRVERSILSLIRDFSFQPKSVWKACCDYCKAEFVGSRDQVMERMFRHMEQHEDRHRGNDAVVEANITYRCRVCVKLKFKSMNEAEEHIGHYHTDRAESCTSDRSRSRHSSSPAATPSSSSDPNSFLCRLCDRSFPVRLFLLEHFVERHELPAEQSTIAQFAQLPSNLVKVSCRFCSMFWSEQNVDGVKTKLRAHKDNAHMDKSVSVMECFVHECLACAAQFKIYGAEELAWHLQSHKDTNYRFTTDHLKQIVRNFREETAYCSFCLKPFPRHKMADHVEIHKDSQFRCTLCREGFTLIEDCEEHVAVRHKKANTNDYVHAPKDQRKWECPVCSFKLLAVDKDAMLYHIKLVHDNVTKEPRLTCRACRVERVFRTEEQLNRHQLEWHTMPQSPVQQLGLRPGHMSKSESHDPVKTLGYLDRIAFHQGTSGNRRLLEQLKNDRDQAHDRFEEPNLGGCPSGGNLLGERDKDRNSRHESHCSRPRDSFSRDRDERLRRSQSLREREDRSNFPNSGNSFFRDSDRFSRVGDRYSRNRDGHPDSRNDWLSKRGDREFPSDERNRGDSWRRDNFSRGSFRDGGRGAPRGSGNFGGRSSRSQDFDRSGGQRGRGFGSSSRARGRGRGFGRFEGREKPQDWKCKKCIFLNFGSRDNCKRCGEGRDEGSGGKNSFGEQQRDDWDCSRCHSSNFGNREECRNCSKPKSDGFVGKETKPDRAEDSRKGGGFGRPRFSAPEAGCKRLDREQKNSKMNEMRMSIEKLMQEARETQEMCMEILIDVLDEVVNGCSGEQEVSFSKKLVAEYSSEEEQPSKSSEVSHTRHYAPPASEVFDSNHVGRSTGASFLNDKNSREKKSPFEYCEEPRREETTSQKGKAIC